MTSHAAGGKRIAIISSSCPPLKTGGITSAHFNLYKALQRRGATVRIFTYGDYSVRNQDTADIIRNGAPWFFVRTVRLLNNLCFRLMDRATIAHQTLDIIESAPGAFSMNRKLKEFFPDVIVLPDHGCPGAMLRKFDGCITVLISHHNPERFLDEPMIGEYSMRDAKMAVAIENRALKKVDRVICPSDYMKGCFLKTYDFDGPLTVIPNIIDTELLDGIAGYDIRKDIGLGHDGILIYVPSAGSPLKGSQFVFEIVRRIAGQTREDIGFYLSGHIAPDLKRELSFAPENARIFMPGHLAFERHLSMVKTCSFGISPTLVENLSMAILEANFSGVPFVTFDTGGNAEVIRDGENGYLVPFLDVEGLIRKASLLLNRDLSDDMKNRTLTYIREAFDNGRILDRFLAFIE